MPIPPGIQRSPAMLFLFTFSRCGVLVLRLLVAINRDLAETSLSIKGDLLDLLNKKFRGFRRGWFQVGVKWCCQESASRSSAVVCVGFLLKQALLL